MTLKVAHLTTVDSSLRYLLHPQLTAVRDLGGESIGISAPGPYADGLVAEGIRHVPLSGSTRSMNPLADLLAAVALWRILRRERPDVLHTHNPKPGLYGRIVGRLARVPIVVNTCHGLYFGPDDPLVKRTILLTLEGIAARFSDAELVQGVEDLDRLVRSHAYPRRRTRLLGNGIDLARFRPDVLTADERARLRADELGARDDQIVVGHGRPPRRREGPARAVRRRPTARRPLRRRGHRPRRPGQARRPRPRDRPGGHASTAWCSWACATTSTGSTGRWTCSCCRRTARASPGRRWRRRPRACPSSPATCGAAGRSSTTA